MSEATSHDAHTARQFGARAAVYVASAVHAAGEPKPKAVAKPAAEPVSTETPTLSFPAGN